MVVKHVIFSQNILRNINMNPNIVNGIPIRTLMAVATKAIPTTINTNPNIAANNLPMKLIVMANKFHTATNGHSNNGYPILRFCGIALTSLKIILTTSTVSIRTL